MEAVNLPDEKAAATKKPLKPQSTNCFETCAPPPKKEKKVTGKKRLGISAETMEDAEDELEVAPKVFPKSEAVREQIRQFTAGKMLFSAMSREQHESIIDAMFEVQCKPAQVVIAQGDMGE
jgi:hypothetical protein